MNEASLMVTNGTGHALTQYGRQGEVVELVNRLMKLHPQAGEVGEQGMMIVAQTAILLGANPLPGANELHVWKDNKGKTCFQLGINFLRRKAMEWGGVLFQVRPRQMNDTERRDYGVAQGNLAAICIGVRVDDMEKWHGRGFGANEVWDMCGRVGIGTASQNEYAKNGRPHLWTVFLRAERDMMRQLFPHQMKTVEQSIPDGDGEPAQWDEQVFDAGQSDEPIIAGEFAEKSVDDLNDELFGSPPANGKPAPSRDLWPADLLEVRDSELSPREQAIADGKKFVPMMAKDHEVTEDEVKRVAKLLGMAAIAKTEEARKIQWGTIEHYFTLTLYEHLPNDLALAVINDAITLDVARNQVQPEQPALIATATGYEEN